MSIFLFWDKLNDEPEILGEDGEFYFYNQDEVLIQRGDWDGAQHWVKLNKMQDTTPLNDFERFDFFSEEDDAWISYDSATREQVQAVHRAAGDPDWRDCP